MLAGFLFIPQMLLSGLETGVEVPSPALEPTNADADDAEKRDGSEHQVELHAILIREHIRLSRYLHSISPLRVTLDGQLAGTSWPQRCVGFGMSGCFGSESVPYLPGMLSIANTIITEPINSFVIAVSLFFLSYTTPLRCRTQLERF